MMCIKKYLSFLLLVLFTLGLNACGSSDNDEPSSGTLQMTVVRVGTTTLDLSDFNNNDNVPPDKPVVASFSAPLQETSVSNAVSLTEKNSTTTIPLTFSFLDNNKTFSALPDDPLDPNKTYVLTISNELRGANKETFPGYAVEFSTVPGVLTITSLLFNDVESLNTTRVQDVPIEGTNIVVTFSAPLNAADITAANFLVSLNGANVPLTVTGMDGNRKVSIQTTQKLKGFAKYQLVVSGEINGEHQEVFSTICEIIFHCIRSNAGVPGDFRQRSPHARTAANFQILLGFRTACQWNGARKNSSGNLRDEWWIGFRTDGDHRRS